MPFQSRHDDAVLKRRALDQAVWLIRDHGDDAEKVIAAKLRRPALGAADRRRYKLTARNLKRLRRTGDYTASGNGAGPVQAFLSWVGALIGIRNTGRRRSRR